MMDREAGFSCAASGRFWGQHEVPRLTKALALAVVNHF
jgi:hypothetical protein